jgi:hypothetical protein
MVPVALLRPLALLSLVLVALHDTNLFDYIKTITFLRDHLCAPSTSAPTHCPFERILYHAPLERGPGVIEDLQDIQVSESISRALCRDYGHGGSGLHLWLLLSLSQSPFADTVRATALNLAGPGNPLGEVHVEAGTGMVTVRLATEVSSSAFVDLCVMPAYPLFYSVDCEGGTEEVCARRAPGRELLQSIRSVALHGHWAPFAHGLEPVGFAPFVHLMAIRNSLNSAAVAVFSASYVNLAVAIAGSFSAASVMVVDPRDSIPPQEMSSLEHFASLKPHLFNQIRPLIGSQVDDDQLLVPTPVVVLAPPSLAATVAHCTLFITGTAAPGGLFGSLSDLLSQAGVRRGYLLVSSGFFADRQWLIQLYTLIAIMDFFVEAIHKDLIPTKEEGPITVIIIQNNLFAD